MKPRSAKPSPIRRAASPVPVEVPHPGLRGPAGCGRASSARPFASPWEEAGVRYGARIKVHAPSHVGVLVELGGEFDISCSEAFDQALRGLETTGPAYVDLSAVTFMDAHCVHRLADGVRAGLLRLCRPSAEVRLSAAACDLVDGQLDIRPDDDRGYEAVIREACKCHDGRAEERKEHRLYFKADH